MIYFPLSALFNLTASLGLAFFILYKNPKAKINLGLAFCCFTAAFWSFFYFVWVLEDSGGLALIWLKMLMLGATWVPFAYYLVVVVFLGQEKEKAKITVFNLFLAVIFSLLLMTDFIVAKVEPAAGFPFWPKPGILFPYFLAMFGGVSLYSVYLSVRALKSAPPLKRAQIKFMLLAIAISVIGGSTNYFLWYDIPVRPYGNIVASFYVFGTVYAIARYRLLDIGLAVKKTFVFLVSLLLVVLSAECFRVLLAKLCVDYIFYIDISALIFAAIAFPLAQKKFSYLANKYFFSPLYNSGRLIEDMTESR